MSEKKEGEDLTRAALPRGQGFLLREVLETEASFSRAVGALALSELIAPVYFSICGTRPSEGALLTREREAESQRWSMPGDLPVRGFPEDTPLLI